MIINNDKILIRYIADSIRNVRINDSRLYNKYIIPNVNAVYPLLNIKTCFTTTIDQDVVILKYCLANNLLEQCDLDDLNEFLIANL